MPQLEPCSSCSRQVVVSRYAWSKQKVYCQICKEFKTKDTSSEIETQELEKSGVEKIESSLKVNNPSLFKEIDTKKIKNFIENQST